VPLLFCTFPRFGSGLVSRPRYDQLAMPGDVIEITPENDPRSRPEATTFANQYAALLAEQAIQNNDQSLRHHNVGLSVWMAFAVAAGAVIASAFVYFLAY
jgi:hypothetical protein